MTQPSREERPATIVISDWLANCQTGQWTPFEAATALKATLAKEGFTVARTARIEELEHSAVAQALPPVSDVCAGGVNPGWDECQKCGATADDECHAALPASSGEVRAELPPHYAFPLRVEGDSIKDANGSYVCDFSSIHGWKARNEMVAFIVAATNAYALKSPSVAVQPVGEVRSAVKAAIRTFCHSLGATAIQNSHGVDRIYYAGISVDALSVAITLALAPPTTVSSTTRGGSE